MYHFQSQSRVLEVTVAEAEVEDNLRASRNQKISGPRRRAPRRLLFFFSEKKKGKSLLHLSFFVFTKRCGYYETRANKVKSIKNAQNPCDFSENRAQ